MTDMTPAGGLGGAVDLSSLVRRANAPAGAPADEDSIVFSVDDLSFGRVMEISQTVPVVVEFGDDRTPDTGIDRVVRTYDGRIALARVDAMANPQLVQAFQVQQLPFVAAVVAGRPLPLYPGILPEEELRGVLAQLLEVAAQQGVTGALEGATGSDEAVEAAPEPLPPLHQAAFDAIEAGDYPAAVSAYEQAIRENPRDTEAVAGLAQVRLLLRLGDGSSEVDAADQAFAAGDAQTAFDVLFAEFGTADPQERDRIRARLLEYFEILGEDPRVGPARRRLASLLY